MPSMHLSQISRWLLQSPPAEWAISQLRELLIGALRKGPIPKHVAFVMDGNRRFARNHGIETIEGHNFGFEALARILEVCYKSGIKTVTIYAFSIENFKRSRHEVDALMELARVKMLQLSQHGDLCQRYGACIRILGRRDLLSQEVLDAVEKAEQMTAGNGDAVLNICIPYTSHDEMTTAIRNTVKEWSSPTPTTLQRPFSQSHISHTIRSRHLSTSSATAEKPRPPSPGEETDTESSIDSSTLYPSPAASTATSFSSPQEFDVPKPPLQPSKSLESFLSPQSRSSSTPPVYPDPETITENTLTEHMLTKGLPSPDLLIRTSGVERLSDFMLWQCHEGTEIAFSKTLWPDFDLWSFLPILVEWQWRRMRGIERATEKKVR